MPERQRYRVAVVVFCDVEGTDEYDAGAGAAMTVRYVLAAEDRGFLPVEHKVPVQHVDSTVRIIDVMEAGMAAGNGYLWLAPTGKSWRERGL